MKHLLASMLLVSCGGTITPAQHVANLRAEIEVVKLGCRVYAMTPSLPREESVSLDCVSLLTNRQPVGASSALPPGAPR